MRPLPTVKKSASSDALPKVEQHGGRGSIATDHDSGSPLRRAVGWGSPRATAGDLMIGTPPQVSAHSSVFCGHESPPAAPRENSGECMSPPVGALPHVDHGAMLCPTPDRLDLRGHRQVQRQKTTFARDSRVGSASGHHAGEQRQSTVLAACQQDLARHHTPGVVRLSIRSIASRSSSVGDPDSPASRARGLNTQKRICKTVSASPSSASPAGRPAMTDTVNPLMSPKAARKVAATATEQSQGPKKTLRWKKGKFIGAGAFGYVCLGLNQDTGELMAVKSITFNAADRGLAKRLAALQREIKVMRNLVHNNIVRYLCTERVGNQINIFMEYIPGGSIQSLLKEFGPLSDETVRHYTRQILEALAFLHSESVVHRDIKAANVLVSVSGGCKLADFGTAVYVQDLSEKELSQEMSGTPCWMAPEVVTNKGFGPPCDIWSLACTVMEMVCARSPFWWISDSPLKLLNWLGGDEPVKLPTDDECSEQSCYIGAGCREFTLLCLQRSPGDRPTARDLLGNPEQSIRGHPFLSRAPEMDEVTQVEPMPSHGADDRYDLESVSESCRVKSRRSSKSSMTPMERTLQSQDRPDTPDRQDTEPRPSLPSPASGPAPNGDIPNQLLCARTASNASSHSEDVRRGTRPSRQITQRPVRGRKTSMQSDRSGAIFDGRTWTDASQFMSPRASANMLMPGSPRTPPSYMTTAEERERIHRHLLSSALGLAGLCVEEGTSSDPGSPDATMLSSRSKARSSGAGAPRTKLVGLSPRGYLSPRAESCAPMSLNSFSIHAPLDWIEGDSLNESGRQVIVQSMARQLDSENAEEVVAQVDGLSDSNYDVEHYTATEPMSTAGSWLRLHWRNILIGVLICAVCVLVLVIVIGAT
eukprot:TRINITY_DN1547_c0_g1_i1.p1 TRINITY_DN1547_c0_g1~~TRINITY_DN1547_c0_g1_i1.p1  ORF type:complete len:874 (+),score=178.12 TRINITY_DN1547_c0_g1_i1:96-2717(+)